MAAMVATVADAHLLCELRDEARQAVVASGATCPERMITGVMIEVPSAALMAPELARIVDFFSIGTNDLTQYVLAADRSNPLLAGLQDALHPAVLRTIAAVVAGARSRRDAAGEADTGRAAGITGAAGAAGIPAGAAGIPVAACGELAGDPAGALVLVGLGVDELSMDSGSLDAVRAALSRVTAAELKDLGNRALAALDAETVRGYAKQVLDAGR
jgi:phosphoenolpyruvate-protein kinase (PTS system EI component)